MPEFFSPLGPDSLTPLAEILESIPLAKKKTGRPRIHPLPAEPPQKRGTKRNQADSREIAKMKVLALLRVGKSVTEALEAVGRKERVFYTWCEQSTAFRERTQAARAAYEIQQRRSSFSVREIAEEFSPVLQENYQSWAEYIVAFRKAYFNFDTFDHQWQILQAWEACPPGGISLILVPPRGGKTTLLLDTVCADLSANANTRRALISESQDFARKMLARVQRRLDYDGSGTPSPLYQHFGPFKPTNRSKKWNADEFTILASDHDEQDPSCTSVSILSNVRGTRWNAIDLDDVQSLRTQGNTRKYLEVFRGDIITRPSTNGRIRVTGSRVCRGDFYEELERLELIDNVVIIPALDPLRPDGERSYFPLQWIDKNGNATAKKEDGVLPLMDDEGEQMGWSDEQLAQRRHKVGEDQWSRVYMMRPQSDFNSMLTSEDIVNASSRDRHVGQLPDRAVGKISGLDPSLQRHAAFTHCAYSAEKLYVMDVVDLFRPITNQNLFAEVERGTIRYRPDYWVIENNTLQSGYLTDDAFLKIKAEFGFEAIGHHTGAQKVDFQLGVPQLMSAIVRGEVEFPIVGENDTSFAALFDQLTSWRPDVPTGRLVQDQVMSLWFCYIIWRRLRERVNLESHSYRRQGLNSVTMYAGAKVHFSSPAADRPSISQSYEQMWDTLTQKEPA